MSRNIVILGGSYAGLSCAHYLLQHALPNLPSDPAYKLILISPSSKVFDRPACPRAMISDEYFDQSKLFVDIPSVLSRYPEESYAFIQGTATRVDHSSRTVSYSSADGEHTVEFYALIIATGASTSSPLLGYTKDYDHLRSSWESFRTALAGAKHIVIAGGGPAGVECAGELGEHFNGRPGWFGSPKPKVEITLATSGGRILPYLRPSLAASAQKMLEARGVKVMLNTKVESVSPEGSGTTDPAAPATVSLTDGSTLQADIYIPATGTFPNTSFLDSGLLTSDKRVDVDPSTLRSKAGERVYALGDVASAARPAVHMIFDQVPTVCANLKRDLFEAAGSETQGKDKEFKEDKRETQLVPIGKATGVGSLMGWSVPGWVVWAIKGRDYWLWTTGGLWSGKQWAKEVK